MDDTIFIEKTLHYTHKLLSYILDTRLLLIKPIQTPNYLENLTFNGIF